MSPHVAEQLLTGEDRPPVWRTKRSSEHHNGNLARRLDAAAGLDPVDAWQHEIEHHEVGLDALGELYPGEAIADDLHVEALAAEARRYRICNRCLVLDHHDPLRHDHRG